MNATTQAKHKRDKQRRLKQKREHRYNVNLNDDEEELFGLINRMTGEHTGVIIRKLALKQALEVLSGDDSVDFSLENLLSKGTLEHLQGS
ncbi:hypothetical protein C7Q29_15695 [Staphylococcus aureus]|nr:hypothetical protein C7Q29_15695 [Staphylococcus aureus]